MKVVNKFCGFYPFCLYDLMDLINSAKYKINKNEDCFNFYLKVTFFFKFSCISSFHLNILVG